MGIIVGMGANKKAPKNNDNEVKKLKAEKENLVKELEAVKAELEEVTADKK